MALIGKQKKLDKNNNGKLDKEDFKMLGKSPSESPLELGVRVNPPDLKGGMPMMGKPKEGISMRIKNRLGLGK